jgi:hypothetical protein
MLLTRAKPYPGYYRRLFREARQFRVNLRDKQWCDLWHQHFDWRGYGNHSHADHRHHLRALFLAFERARRELATQPIPHQIFLYISAGDAGSNALYVHTANPNGTPFPRAFSGVRELRHVPGLLRGLCNTEHYWIGSEHTNDGLWYIIQARDPTMP